MKYVMLAVLGMLVLLASVNEVNAKPLGPPPPPPFWALGGNTGNGPADFLGTTDNNPLVIKTDGIERMRVTESGEVGIGTTPDGDAKLDVIGTSSFAIEGTAFLGAVTSVGVRGLAPAGTGFGVVGQAQTDGTGGFFISNSFRGLEAQSPSGLAGRFQSTSGTGIRVLSSSGDLIVAVDRDDNDEAAGGAVDERFKVDNLGNVTADGTIKSGSSITIDGINDEITSNGDLELHVSSGRALRLEPDTGTISPNVIGGFSGNSVAAGVSGATIGGGGLATLENEVSGNFGTVGGGNGNTASNNVATVAGGSFNVASNSGATVGGGNNNIASGNRSTVPGGIDNTADGDFSLAAGRQAKANHDGAFVWSDSTGTDLSSTVNDQFTARASGGVRFFSNSTATTGVTLAAGGGAWANISDRNAKANFTPVDAGDILERLSAIPIETWNYKSQDPSIRHMGPMAQDFYAAFGLGEDDKYISTLDPDGVALAAIQGLYQIVQEQDARIASLEARLEALEQAAGINGSSGEPMSSGSLPNPWLLFGSLALGGMVLGGMVTTVRWTRKSGD